MNEHREEKIAYSIPEAAKASGLSASYLYRLSAEGKLPVCKVGARCVILIDDWKLWLRDHLRNGGGK
jgi:hypothetical protein